MAEAGSYEVRVNSATVLSGSADTRVGSSDHANRVRLFGRDEAVTAGNQYDDWWVGTDFLGDKRVVTTYPAAAGDSSDFTPSAGDNWAAVDDNPADGDSSYVESSTPGAADLYTHGSVTADSIEAVQICIVAKKTDVTNFDMYIAVKSGATTDDGVAVTVGATDYASFSRVLEDDPATGLPWTPSGLSAAQFGPKLG